MSEMSSKWEDRKKKEGGSRKDQYFRVDYVVAVKSKIEGFRNLVLVVQSACHCGRWKPLVSHRIRAPDSHSASPPANHNLHVRPICLSARRLFEVETVGRRGRRPEEEVSLWSLTRLASPNHPSFTSLGRKSPRNQRMSEGKRRQRSRPTSTKTQTLLMERRQAFKVTTSTRQRLNCDSRRNRGNGYKYRTASLIAILTLDL